MPSVAAQTKGEKQTLSTSPICSLHAWCFSCTITSGQWKARIGAHKRVKHPNIKGHVLPIFPPKMTTSEWALSSPLAVAYQRDSRSNGCRAGSSSTSQHISLKGLTIKSCILLWKMEGNPPTQKFFSTCTSLRQVFWPPTKPLKQTELLCFRQCENMLSNWKGY